MALKKNKIFVAVAVFAILLLVVILTSEDPYDNKTLEQLPEIPELDTDIIDQIELINKTEAITFSKKGDDWWISKPESYKADKNFKIIVLDKLKKIELQRLVSNNKDGHKSFEVDEEGTRLRAFAKGQELLSIIVGKNTPDYRGSFVRFPKSDGVYATKKILGGSLKKKVKEWRNKLLVSLSLGDIKKMTVNLPKENFALYFEEKIEDEKAISEWKLEGDDKFEVNQGNAKTLAHTLANLAWAEIVDEPENLKQYDLQVPKSWIEITLRDNKTYKFLFGNIDEEKRLANCLVDGQTPVYKLRSYQQERVLKNKNHYLKK